MFFLSFLQIFQKDLENHGNRKLIFLYIMNSNTAKYYTSIDQSEENYKFVYGDSETIKENIKTPSSIAVMIRRHPRSLWNCFRFAFNGLPADLVPEEIQPLILSPGNVSPPQIFVFAEAYCESQGY